MSDIKVSDRRSVRRIPLPENRTRGGSLENNEPLLYEEDRYETVEILNTGWSRVALWLAVAACVVILIIVLSWTFTGATVSVTPKSAAVTLAGGFVAVRAGGALSFESLLFQKSGEEVVPALTQKRVSERASGVILVYNNYSEAPQRLIKNTRFESPEGRIYRIDRSIVVPGQKKQDGRMVPGNVEAVIFADSPGEAYNSPLSDFTVPGFKNDSSRYAAFYARSKTPISGGFEGALRVPTEAAEEAARKSIRERMTQELIAQARQALPEGKVFLDGAYRVAAEALPHQARGSSEVAVREQVMLTAFFFPRAELTRAIAKAALPHYDDKPVSIPSLESLTFQASADASDGEELLFTLAGDARVVYGFDARGLAEALRGKQKSDVARELSAFPTIEKVDVTLRPFWRRTFPEKAEKIKIETVATAAAR